MFPLAAAPLIISARAFWRKDDRTPFLSLSSRSLSTQAASRWELPKTLGSDREVIVNNL